MTTTIKSYKWVTDKGAKIEIEVETTINIGDINRLNADEFNYRLLCAKVNGEIYPGAKLSGVQGQEIILKEINSRQTIGTALPANIKNEIYAEENKIRENKLSRKIAYEGYRNIENARFDTNE